MAYTGQTYSVGQVLTSTSMTALDANIDHVRNYNKGTSAPTELVAGVPWLDDTATPWVLKIYDGTDWITVAGVNATDNEYLPGNGQVFFPATQNASTDANCLDDYEEGTWTPIDSSGASLSFTSVTARYVKVGQLVAAGFTLTYPSTVNGSTALVGGLPFTAETSANIWGGMSVLTTLGTLSGFQILSNSTTFNIVDVNGNARTNATMSLTINRSALVYKASA